MPRDVHHVWYSCAPCAGFRPRLFSVQVVSMGLFSDVCITAQFWKCSDRAARDRVHACELLLSIEGCRYEVRAALDASAWMRGVAMCDDTIQLLESAGEGADSTAAFQRIAELSAYVLSELQRRDQHDLSESLQNRSRGRLADSEAEAIGLMSVLADADCDEARREFLQLVGETLYGIREGLL